MIPMNLIGRTGRADYFRTGSWSKKAIAEAKRFGEVTVAVDSEVDGRFTGLPTADGFSVSADAAYLHYTPNETIEGVEFAYIPDTGEVPLVADMSSTILSRPLDVSRYGLIYAGAQKNIGPAGLTIVIVRDDLIGSPLDRTPAMFNYATHAENDSMYNTPPTYGWYLAGLVFKWLKEQGGLAGMAEVNRRKAAMLYEAIDASGFYANPVDPACRSWMNVPFTLADASLDAEFLKLAGEAGLVTLKGHRSVGGMRASIYNAMPEAGVRALVEFMTEFERTNG
jgi:phosphoserine aminotransferase